MGEVTPLHGGQVWRPPVDPVPQLVDELRKLLTEAEAGELRNFVGCGLNRDGETISTLYAGEIARARFTLLGGIYRCASNLKRRLFPEEESPKVDG